MELVQCHIWTPNNIYPNVECVFVYICQFEILIQINFRKPTTIHFVQVYIHICEDCLKINWTRQGWPQWQQTLHQLAPPICQFDIWHVTCVMWHMTHDGWWTLCEKFRPLALMVWDCWSIDNLEENSGGVCRTAKATLGLLKTLNLGDSE